MSNESTRAPLESRTRLIESAFANIYRHGFQGARVDRILDQAEMTKGAFYHHFKSKQELGYAVVDELLLKEIEGSWVQPLHTAQDVIDTLKRIIEQRALGKEEHLTLGCPINNLAQEMSPLDEGFRRRINRIFTTWTEAIAQALETGRTRGQLRPDIDPGATALFIVASLEGCTGMAKQDQNTNTLEACFAQLLDYLESLRA